jgi:protein arginine kinase activator
MKCEMCHTNEATIHLTQVVDGVVKKVHLCEECAAANGFDIHSPMSITDILMGMTGQPETPLVKPIAGGKSEKACPVCHLRQADFKKSGRLGCPACYEAFADQLMPLLKVMHRHEQHKGKVPACEQTAMRTSVEVEQLQQQLQEAIEAENYEEAARLRDMIQSIRKADGEAASGA